MRNEISRSDSDATKLFSINVPRLVSFGSCHTYDTPLLYVTAPFVAAVRILAIPTIIEAWLDVEKSPWTSWLGALDMID